MKINGRVKDISGNKFGRLSVIYFTGINQLKKSTWLCKCDCGKEVSALGPELRSGHKKSCGCLRKEVMERGTTFRHGAALSSGDSPTYRTWCAAKTRCTNPNTKSHKNYGGRGIKMCDRWMNSFESFLSDMGERPSSQHSIERIKNDVGYEPGNCRWATKVEQNNNTRQCRHISFCGETLNVTQWSKRVGISRTTITQRLNSGWTIADVLQKQPKTISGTKQNL